MPFLVNGEVPEKIIYNGNVVNTLYYGGSIIWPVQTSPFLCTQSGTYNIPASSFNYTLVGGGGTGGSSTGTFSRAGKTVLTVGSFSDEALGGACGNGKTGAGGAATAPGGKAGHSKSGNNGGKGGDGYAPAGHPFPYGGSGTSQIHGQPIVTSSAGGKGFGAGGGGFGYTTKTRNGWTDKAGPSGGGGSGAIKSGTYSGGGDVVTVTVSIGAGKTVYNAVAGTLVANGRGADGAVMFTW